MSDFQRKALGHISSITKVGLFLGVLVALTGLFVSGIKMSYTLSIGISIAASSMLVFGFALFISLMTEVKK